MQLRQLRIDHLRLIEHVEFNLAPHWNFFVGPNGAGKTTLLEAAFLLSRGRSFRSASKDALIRRGASGYAVFGELAPKTGPVSRVGLARSALGLEARLDGNPVAAAELMRQVAVLCFEPGSHDLISGPSEVRRRFLDWGVFHVEHDFLLHWRRVQRTLKQRNALLRSQSSDSALTAWDEEFVAASEPLTAMRRRYFDALEPKVIALLAALLPELGPAHLEFQRGHPPDVALAETLTVQRERDFVRGYTGSGPHRADWTLSFEAAPRRDHLSRGQEKLCAFACVFAQAQLYAETAEEWPILCLDDLASEIDVHHRELVISMISSVDMQILATGTQELDALALPGRQLVRFHVEQGRVTTML